MRIVNTFIVWDKGTIQYVKIHQCKNREGTFDMKFFMETYNGRLNLMDNDEAIAMINQ
jgi:hypothetical protein